jgi:pyrimidine operon attenuation protein/uracil phosphoribosyltransferase
MALHLKRLCFQVYENLNDSKKLAIIGLQPRGVLFARRIYDGVLKLSKNKNVLFGILDPTFHRDDFKIRELKPETTDIRFLLDNIHVVLADDVLHTGRTIRSGLDAIQAFGRPEKVELMVLVDRRYSRDFPIQPDYTGLSVDTIEKQKVEVKWKEIDGIDSIELTG